MPRCLILLALSLRLAPAQTPQPAPSFEVASIKPAAPCCAPGQWRSPKAGEDRIDFRYVTLRYCIGFAFRVEDYQISGPPWLSDVHFDIEAKGAEGARHEQLPDMLQALLAERFGLRIHREVKDLPALVLVVGKGGPKLQESVDAKQEADAAFGISMSYEGVGRIEAKRASMASFARNLTRFLHRPVIDHTGLNGRYDFDVDFSSEDAKGITIVAVDGASPPAPESAVSIFTSIQKLGLKLETSKVPLEMVVVDQIQKTPTEN